MCEVLSLLNFLSVSPLNSGCVHLCLVTNGSITRPTLSSLFIHFLNFSEGVTISIIDNMIIMSVIMIMRTPPIPCLLLS